MHPIRTEHTAPRRPEPPPTDARGALPRSASAPTVPTRARLAPSLAALLLLASGARAQDAGDEPDPAERLRALEEELARVRADQDEEIDALHERIDELGDELAEARRAASTPGQQRLNVFNPQTTVFGNFLGRADDRRAFVDDDPGERRIDDRMWLREVEVDFRAAVDPWADAVVILTSEAETPGEYSTGVEEGYLVLKRLPILDSAPAGLKLQAGRFRPGFGRTNRTHLHDLAQPSYPLALSRFLGPEGYLADGISASFFLPSPGENHTLTGEFTLLDGGGIGVDPGADASEVAGLGRVSWFHDIGDGKSLEVGASGWQSDSDHRLLGLDATYVWKPYLAGEWHSFVTTLELFQGDLDENGLASSPQGADIWAQYQTSRNSYVGLRLGRSDSIDDESLDTTRAGVFVSYYTTEFLRLRIGYEHTESDDPLLDGADSLLFELNFVFGSHPVEPYWVNR